MEPSNGYSRQSKVIGIIFLDFRKAFDLIDHNVLLENCCKIGVRPAHLLAGRVRTYVIDFKFENELSASCVIKGGVPQGSRIFPIAFVAHINGLNLVLNDSDKNDHKSGTNEDNIDEDLTLFMDDTTLSEVINVREL